MKGLRQSVEATARLIPQNAAVFTNPVHLASPVANGCDGIFLVYFWFSTTCNRNGLMLTMSPATADRCYTS